jgi:hypothetical protein
MDRGEWQAVVKTRAKGRCEACLDEPGHNAHHRRLRSQGGRDDPANGVALCTGCHNLVHAHPRWARDVGLIVSAYADHPTEPWTRPDPFKFPERSEFT